MKKSVLLLLLFCISFILSHAARIEGIIKDKDNNPLEFATIYIDQTKQGTSSDVNGKFIFSNIQPGNYKLRVTLSFYKEKLVECVITEPNQIINLPITLDKEDLQLNEVVVVGNGNRYTTNNPSNSIRLDEPLIEVPQNIQVINTQMLADRQITSMSDGITGTVSGVTKLEHWGDSYTRINMRGSRAAAFREGMNMTSNWGPLTEDMSFVQEIEFVKGPAGFMMSNGEPSGIYNVVTKKPTGVTKGNVGFTFGSYDLYRATIDLDGKLEKTGKLLYRLNLMGQTKNSYRQYEFADRYSIAPVISYKVDENTLITAQYAFQYMKSSNIGSYYNFSANGFATLPYDYSFLEPGLSPTKVYDHSFILNLQHQLNENWKLTAQGAYFNYNKEGESMWYASDSKTYAPLVFENGDVVRSISMGDAINEMKFGQVFVNGNLKTGVINHRILGGLDMGDKHQWYDWSQSHVLDTIGSYNIYSGNNKVGSPYYGYPNFDRSKSLKERANTTQITQTYTGLYLQDELGFFDERLRLTLAGRYTYTKDASYGTTKTEVRHFSPRVGVSFSIDPSFSAYALYDQTFNPQMGLQRSGDKAKPLTGNNWEFGLKKHWFNNKLNTSVSVYQILKNNEMTSDPDNNPSESYVVQVGQSKSKGVEVDIIGEVFKGFNVIANYAYTDYKVSKSVDPDRPVGMRLPGYAAHTFNIWFKYAFFQGPLEGFNVSVGQSSQIDRSSWGAVKEDGKSALPDYFRFDAAAGWHKGNLSVALNVYNLANRYLYSGSLSGGIYYWQSEPKRNFKLGISYNF